MIFVPSGTGSFPRSDAGSFPVGFVPFGEPIFDSRICLLEASERSLSALPARAVPRRGGVGAWLGFEGALRIESGERSPVERRLRD
jgi:hypothetical protein